MVQRTVVKFHHLYGGPEGSFSRLFLPWYMLVIFSIRKWDILQFCPKKVECFEVIKNQFVATVKCDDILIPIIICY